ncbi:MAG: hypothetical protein RL156_1494 [Bacteroidota bacterium]|jgi:short-subunit dehydrogenase
MITSLAVIGASSAIAQEVARLYARSGAALVITARSAEKCEILKADLLARGAQAVDTLVYDAEKNVSGSSVMEEIARLQPRCCSILIAHGVLSDNDACAHDAGRTVHDFTLNATSVIALSAAAAAWYEQHSYSEKPCIAVISSVAGDRGRGSNYVYGAAKGAVSIFLQGLRNRLYAKGIHVLTIKPGFVDTPMTAHIAKNPLFASPQSVARSIVRAMERRADVVYTPGFWRYIMLVVRLIPERVFKRLGL